jgi:hypothetical protein
VVSFGMAEVWIAGKGWELIQAPFTGITKPGTRRILRTLTPCVWTTCHVTDKTTVEEVEQEIIDKRPNPFLDAEINEVLIEIRKIEEDEKNI